jgi:hypothetical protein
MKKLFFVALAVTIFLWAVAAQAMTVTLAWDPNSETDLAGYNIYWSTTAFTSSSAVTPIPAGRTKVNIPLTSTGFIRTTPEWAVPNLPDNVTVYFGLTAYDNESPSLESGFSNIVTAIRDTIAPSVPVVSPALPATTTLASITIAGTKEANSSILIGGVEKVAISAGTTWTTSMPLVVGLNTFAITSKDAAGNTSIAVTVTTTRLISSPPVVPTNMRVIVTGP